MRTVPLPALAVIAWLATMLLFLAYAYAKVVHGLGYPAAYAYLGATAALSLAAIVAASLYVRRRTLLRMSIYGLITGVATGAVSYITALLMFPREGTDLIPLGGTPATLVVVIFFFSLALGSWLWGLLEFTLFAFLERMIKGPGRPNDQMDRAG